MDTVTAVKSDVANRIEGIILTALQAVPPFAASVLSLKLLGFKQVGSAWLFVGVTSLTLALFTAWLGPKYPKRFKNYEPAFFDASLWLEQKIRRRLANAAAMSDLLQVQFILAGLAIVAASVA